MKLSFYALITPKCPIYILNFRLHLLYLVIVQWKPDIAQIIVHNSKNQIMIFMRADFLQCSYDFKKMLLSKEFL